MFCTYGLFIFSLPLHSSLCEIIIFNVEYTYNCKVFLIDMNHKCLIISFIFISVVMFCMHPSQYGVDSHLKTRNHNLKVERSQTGVTTPVG